MLNTATAVPDSTRRGWAWRYHPLLRVPQPRSGVRIFTVEGVAVGKPMIRDYGMKPLTVIDPAGCGLCFQHPEKAA